MARCTWMLGAFFGLALALRAQPDAEFTAARTANLERGTWQRLTADGRTTSLIAGLRALGWPEFIVRAMVYEQVRGERFAAETEAVARAIESQYFWRTPYAIDAKVERLRREFSRKVSDAVHEAMGPGADALSHAERAVYRRQFGELPAEKIDALQRVRDDYRDLIKIAQAEAAVVAARLPSAREAAALLAREQAADLAKLLTAEERVEWERRQRWAAQEHVRSLAGGRAATPAGWAEAQRADLAALQQRLRAAGFPAPVVRAALTREVSARVMARELREIYEPGDGGYRLDTPEKQAAKRDLERDQDALLQLASDGVHPRMANRIVLAYQRRVIGPVSEATLARLLALPESAGPEETSALLAPEERERWELVRGPWAQYLAQTVVGFSATFDEVIAVSRIYRPIFERIAPDGQVVGARGPDFAEAEKAAVPALREALGEERAADFLQARLGDRSLNELVAYLDLPISAARKVAAIRAEVEEAEARRRRKGAAGESGQHTPPFGHPSREGIERRVGEVLGARGLELYREYGGQWMANVGR